jgi:uncharacterized protein (DUF1778 family)
MTAMTTHKEDNKTEQVTVRFEPLLKSVIAQLAAKDGRSLSSYLHRLAAKHARKFLAEQDAA